MKEYFIWLLKFLTIIVFFVVVIPIALAAIIASAAIFAQSPGLVPSAASVAVVELSGEIRDSRDVVNELTKQVRSSNIKGVVLRVNSPGGAVAPSQDIYLAVKRLKTIKPIVVSMGALAASGGLYSSLGASKIYAEPGTITGSIGVIFQVPNFTEISKKIGVEMITITTGKFKDVGNSFRPMTEEDRSFLHQVATETYNTFVDAVASERSIPREQVMTFADGRIIIGSQAKRLGLIDELGDVWEAARAVYELSGAPLAADELPTLFYPDEKYRELKKFFEQVTLIMDSLTSHRGVNAKYIMH